MKTDYEKKLIAQILRICEKQYRKGFQHGYYERAGGIMKDYQVDNFRFHGEKQKYKKVINPLTGRKEKPLDRIICELHMPDMDELKQLLSK